MQLAVISVGDPLVATCPLFGHPNRSLMFPWKDQASRGILRGSRQGKIAKLKNRVPVSATLTTPADRNRFGSWTAITTLSRLVAQASPICTLFWKTETCTVRYAETADNHLILRPRSRGLPTEGIAIEEVELPADYLIGRVCYIGG